MKLFESLRDAVAMERDYLFSSPIIVDALRGDITRPQYVAFLKEAYFHVRETVPLLMACGSRLGAHQEWLRGAVAHYIEDEYGHEQWILNDIRACGADADAISNGTPSRATELMVSYAWDTIQRRDPVGFFGMVYVLEGTSVSLALRAVDRIQATLGLPSRAFTYLRSHGELDQEHVHHLADILGRFDDPADRDAVVRCARGIFWLYGNVFRGLDERAARPAQELRRSA